MSMGFEGLPTHNHCSVWDLEFTSTLTQPCWPLSLTLLPSFPFLGNLGVHLSCSTPYVGGFMRGRLLLLCHSVPWSQHHTYALNVSVCFSVRHTTPWKWWQKHMGSRNTVCRLKTPVGSCLPHYCLTSKALHLKDLTVCYSQDIFLKRLYSLSVFVFPYLSSCSDHGTLLGIFHNAHETKSCWPV